MPFDGVTEPSNNATEYPWSLWCYDNDTDSFFLGNRSFGYSAIPYNKSAWVKENAPCSKITPTTQTSSTPTTRARRRNTTTATTEGTTISTAHSTDTIETEDPLSSTGTETTSSTDGGQTETVSSSTSTITTEGKKTEENTTSTSSSSPTTGLTDATFTTTVTPTTTTEGERLSVTDSTSSSAGTTGSTLPEEPEDRASEGTDSTATSETMGTTSTESSGEGGEQNITTTTVTPRGDEDGTTDGTVTMTMATTHLFLDGENVTETRDYSSETESTSPTEEWPYPTKPSWGGGGSETGGDGEEKTSTSFTRTTRSSTTVTTATTPDESTAPTTFTSAPLPDEAETTSSGTSSSTMSQSSDTTVSSTVTKSTGTIPGSSGTTLTTEWTSSSESPSQAGTEFILTAGSSDWTTSTTTITGSQESTLTEESRTSTSSTPNTVFSEGTTMTSTGSDYATESTVTSLTEITVSAISPITSSADTEIFSTGSMSITESSTSPSNSTSSSLLSSSFTSSKPSTSSPQPETLVQSGKILGQNMAPYPNCSVLIQKAVQLPNETTVNTTAWVNANCGTGFEVPGEVNMTDADNAQILGSTAVAYDNCTLSLSKWLRYPNGTEVNMTTWYDTGCPSSSPSPGLGTTSTVGPTSSNATVTGSSSPSTLSSSPLSSNTTVVDSPSPSASMPFSSSPSFPSLGSSSSSSTPSSPSSSTKKMNSSSTAAVQGAPNVTNTPTKPPTSSSTVPPGTTAVLGSAGRVLFEDAVSYPNCSVLLASTLAYANGTKANVTKWIDSGCGKGFNTTVGNNMINHKGATIISQVGEAYANCTVDVSQFWEFPNGTLLNTTTTFFSDCSTPAPTTTTTPTPVDTGKVLGTALEAYPNCTVVSTKTVRYTNGTTSNWTTTFTPKCGSPFEASARTLNMTTADGSKIIAETATAYNNCTVLTRQNLQYPNGTKSAKNTWSASPCPSTTFSSTTVPPITTKTTPPKVTAKILGVTAVSLPNCTVVITQTMQYSNGTVVNSTQSYNQNCGSNFTADYSDQNLTMPDGGRILSATGSAYSNCSLSVNQLVEYPNKTKTTPTTWYDTPCNTSTTRLFTAARPTTTKSTITSTTPEVTTRPPLETSTTYSALESSPSTTTTPRSTSLPAETTTVSLCSVQSFQNDSANTILVNGTNMIHTCSTGYTFPDGSPMKIFACVNGVWQGLTSATCQPNSCAPLSISLANARRPQSSDSVMTARQPLGTVVVHSCAARYVFPSGEPLRIYECVKGGIWTGAVNSDQCQYVEL